MSSQLKIIKRVAVAGVITLGFAFVGFVFAQTSSSQNITFPISELGNCTDSVSCHVYCNVPDHMQACTAFAQSHGLEAPTDAQKAGQFAKLLAKGSGPGGCTSPDSCNAYCSTVSHLNVCVAFAKANNLTDDNLVQGEKIAGYLTAGGHMPGNCDSKNSCETYCSDQSHAQECMQFAQAIGIKPDEGGMSPQMTQKFSELQSTGKIPSGCTTLSDCLRYCSDQSHGSECAHFGEDMGFPDRNSNNNGVGPDVRGNHPGPGGCHSDVSCKAYCSDPSHSVECTQFSRQMGNYVQGFASGTPEGTCGAGQYWNGNGCINIIGSSTNGYPYGARIIMDRAGVSSGTPPLPPCEPGAPCNQGPEMQNNQNPCEAGTPCNSGFINNGSNGNQQPPQQNNQPQPSPLPPVPPIPPLPPQSSLSPLSVDQASVFGIFGTFIKSVQNSLLGR